MRRILLGILLVLPSPVHAFMGPAAIAVVAAAIVLVVVAPVRPQGGSWWARLRRGAARDIRAGLLTRRALPPSTSPHRLTTRP